MRKVSGDLRLGFLLAILCCLAAYSSPASGGERRKGAVTPKIKVLQWGCRAYPQESGVRYEAVGLLQQPLPQDDKLTVIYVTSSGSYSRVATLDRELFQTTCPASLWLGAQMSRYAPPTQETPGRAKLRMQRVE